MSDLAVNIRDRIADTIRRVDGNNDMDISDLGWEIATQVVVDRSDLYGADIVLFCERVNADKSMGAGALADAITGHFNLDN